MEKPKDPEPSLESASTVAIPLRGRPRVRDGDENNNDNINRKEDRTAAELVRQYSLDLVRSLSHTQSQTHNDAQDKLRDIPDTDGTAFSTASAQSAASLAADPALDPTSPAFDARRWAQALLHACSQDPDRYPRPRAGVAYRRLRVHGYGRPTDYQKDVFNVLLEGPQLLYQMLRDRRRSVPILRGSNDDADAESNASNGLDGLVRSGEMLLVLGRPGSGVTTLLKTLSGETNGLALSDDACISYQGIPLKTMQARFRGEVIYQAETDVHFPQLTVGQTLQFAAEARTPRHRPTLPGADASSTAGIVLSRRQYARHLRDVVLALFGIAHTVDTRVGSDLVRGVSGGERKRVSIAEAALSGSAVQCWDNSTRGLDSATALSFARTLRLATDLAGTTALVAMYQASEEAYQIFDKVCLLYEGRQIYFGPTDAAKAFFVGLGYHCPERQTTADFLTALTNPAERIVRADVDPRSVPRTPDEFAVAWQASAAYAQLQRELDAFDAAYPMDGRPVAAMATARKAHQALLTPSSSPYTLSFPMQVQLCMVRGYQRLMGDKTFFLVTVGGNLVISLVLGSVFYQLPPDASTINTRCILLFFAILFNALSSALEILSLYAQRPIVEKHARYALYQPAAEAVASALCELPSKILSALAFNIPLYFMANLRHGAGHVFIFLLFGFACTLTMSTILRTIGQASRTVHQALTPAAVFIIALVIYTGLVLPTRAMQGWLRWIHHVNPIAYAYESLVVNELGGRAFPCLQFVPPYPQAPADERTCATAGAAPGAAVVLGDVVLEGTFSYRVAHKWRNLGILAAFMLFFFMLYLVAAELVSASRSKGEVLVFRRGHKKTSPTAAADTTNEKQQTAQQQPNSHPKKNNESSQPERSAVQKSIFHWRDVCYDITVKGGEARRLLNHVDGWVKPGTLTVLMTLTIKGVSGAGKTTLLDVLANRVTMGVVSGVMLVDGVPRGPAFQRTTGYVQQQDVNLETSTVREALQFSARLRQPQSVSAAAKDAYVEEVIALLEMTAYADAIVGVVGEGLNVEQRKRLTIGVELAAKPDLLLFLDEPTSGLDSQTAWAVTALVRKLSDHGQAVLCTIHQPSARLFEQFDRLLLLASGGRTVYFGEIGPGAQTLIRYFEKHQERESGKGSGVNNAGAGPCGPDENPAEWMLRVIGAAPGVQANQDWAATWRASDEYKAVQAELAALEGVTNFQGTRAVDAAEAAAGADLTTTYATPFSYQLYMCTRRVFEQYWRTPSYIYAKLILCFATSLFIGLSFRKAPLTEQGLQSQMFSIFLLLVVFAFLTYQTMPHFIRQRELYEIRERAARTYSWTVFMLANIVVELPWNTLAALLVFVPFYYLVGMEHNAVPTGTVAERGGLMFLLLWVFLVFESTFADMVVAGAPTAELGATLALLLFAFCLIFCGVMVPPTALPGFWMFMYRVSPLTYLIGGLLATGVARHDVQCSPLELLTFLPPANTTCGQYLTPFMQLAGGTLANTDAVRPAACQFCALATTDAYLASVGIAYADRWRNFGLMWAYVAFNLAAALGLYWAARAPKAGLKAWLAQRRGSKAAQVSMTRNM
ncbi:ABC transporter [Niveomyces insectorum RCEF 264]|uniref:ABC transporter n=1 Tax=Niveomyces insectorum RCEF 264 TaxID=1081102 RepID=A0A167SR98_9HYPO|nr:ABC transporter [Niveomyces insectorum RCEF 264]